MLLKNSMAPVRSPGAMIVELCDRAAALVLLVSQLPVRAPGVLVVPHVPVQRREVPHLVDCSVSELAGQIERLK
jgi:hypothetical protein